MNFVLSYIISLFVLSSLIGEGAGIVAWKEQSFHKDSLANVATYSQVKKTVYEGIFNIKGKEIYLPSGSYWFVELPKNLPLELADSYQYEDLLRQKGEISDFLKRFPKSSAVLNPWVEKLQEYQDKYDSGQYLVEGRWIEKSVYEKQQVELKEKRRQRSQKEVQKRQHAPKKGTGEIELAKGKNPQSSYVDGLLQGIKDGSNESAGVVVKRLEQARAAMDDSGRNLAQQLIKSITLLFSAQAAYKNAIQQQGQAKIRAEKYESQAENEMRPSPLTGKPNTYMANKSRNNAKQVLLDAEHAVSEGKAVLLQALKQNDVLACSLYKKYPRDADSLSSALEVIAQTYRGEIDFRSGLGETKNKENLEKASLNRELISECKKGNVQNVEKFLQLGADVNAKDKTDFTPLHSASFSGHDNDKIVELLIKAGADVDAKKNYEETPLHSASYLGHEKIVEVLIKEGADVNAKNNDGFTPLYAASLGGCEKIVELLIKIGADVNAKDNKNETPLMMASGKGYEKVVQLLIESGADVNVKNEDDETPLREASRNGHDKIVELLIKAGADVNAKNKDGFTPLHGASIFGYDKIVELLIKDRADVNAKSKDDFTPLYWASFFGREKTVELLIKAGADVNVKNKDGLTPLHVASVNGHDKIVQILREAGATPVQNRDDDLSLIE